MLCFTVPLGGLNMDFITVHLLFPQFHTCALIQIFFCILVEGESMKTSRMRISHT